MNPSKTENKAKATLTFRLLRVLLQLLLRVLFKIEIIDKHGNKAKFPKKGGYILASNHNSWLDSFLYLAFAPASPRIYFLADKKNMVSNRFRRFVTGKIGGVILVDLHNKQRLSRELSAGVAEVLAGGGVFGIFPEGAVPILETGALLPFKKGLGYFATDNNVPVLPIALSGTRELYWRKRITIVVGEMQPTIPPEIGKGKAQAEAITDTIRQAIMTMRPTVEPFDPQRRKFLRNSLSNLFSLNTETEIARMEWVYWEMQHQTTSDCKVA